MTTFTKIQELIQSKNCKLLSGFMKVSVASDRKTSNMDVCIDNWDNLVAFRMSDGSSIKSWIVILEANFHKNSGSSYKKRGLYYMSESNLGDEGITEEHMIKDEATFEDIYKSLTILKNHLG